MKIFELQTNLTSYSYSVIKIVIFVLLILFSVNRNNIFHFSNTWVDIFVTIICFILSIACILGLYISIGELFYTYSNRKTINLQNMKLKLIEMKEIIRLVCENDIIEIETVLESEIVNIGSSSECNYSSSLFVDKKYYISKSEFDSLEQFEKALSSLFPQNIIPVFSIDGVRAE